MDYGIGNQTMILGLNMPAGSPNVVTFDSSREMSSLPNVLMKSLLKSHPKTRTIPQPGKIVQKTHLTLDYFEVPEFLTQNYLGFQDS